MNLDSILNKERLSRDDLISLMSLEKEVDLDKLYKKAYQLKSENVGRKVYYRGIIEFSNRCIKNCNYCGIRKDNKNVNRFMMSKEEILDSARWIYENNYGSLVLQSGERDDEEYIGFVENLLKEIKELSNGELGITISLGEQKRRTYQRWFEAGAHRYLLRIESSNEKLYNSLHPKDHDFKRRLESIDHLKDIGYQVGTGVMIGFPGQSKEDVVDDLLFFKENDIDMVGMGPYVIHKQTPTAKKVEDAEGIKERNFDWGLKAVALLRLLMPDINLAATTALQALNPIGRELALKAGANILMPIVTHKNYRKDYQLYEDKPCVDEEASDCKGCLANRVKTVGDEIEYGKWGDSPHYFKRMEESNQILRGDLDARDTSGQ